MAEQEVIKVGSALLSVADKRGAADLGRALAGLGVGIYSTGGTASALREGGVECTEIAELTGMSEAMDGRLKTLHPALLGGILCNRDHPEQGRQLEALGGRPIELVIVNFYPFEAGASDASPAELVELIDIGGPTMVRAAAKNHRHVAVITDPDDYGRVIAELRERGGAISRDTAAELAAKAFVATASYDSAIASRLRGGDAASAGGFARSLISTSELRYGENPHQRGWLGQGASGIEQIGGPQLSYNNLQDAVAAWRCCTGFDQPCCAIIKHTTPCGVAVGDGAADAHAKALAADELSAYGGVVACNREIDAEALASVKGVFCEVLVAPAYSDEAADQLSRSKRIKSVRGPLGEGGFDARIWGDLALIQSRDEDVVGESDLRQVSKQEPSAEQRADLLFAWRVAMAAKSNAVVLARDGATLGIGSGQTSRVEAARIAIERARAKGHDPRGAAAASDGFFPFPDGLECLAEAGVAAVIHPGGSKRDSEVAAAADEAGMALVVTGCRHFSH